MKLKERILNLIFPPKCPFCGKVGEQVGICPKCQMSLPKVPEEMVPRALGDGLFCTAPLWYSGTVRQALLRMKFHGGSGMAEPLGALLTACAAERFGGEFDLVTWVPISRKRARQRGYDQSRLLAESACRAWDTRPVELLRKVQDNPPQSTVTGAAARRANVLGVYDAVNTVLLRDKRVLLVDDICTTGATLRECARVLKEAGAAHVVCVALALTQEENKEKNSCIPQ